MINFIKLVQNENMKIFRRPATWAMIGLLLVIVLTVGLVSRFVFDNPGNAYWQDELTKENIRLEQNLTQGHMPKTVKDRFENTIKINQYRIDNEIPPEESQSIWGFMNTSIALVSIVTLFTVIVASTSVAGEFSWGTIKLLLIRPASRSKILLSKYLAALFYALSLLLLLFFFSFATGGLLYGLENIGQPYLGVVNGEVIEKSMTLHVFSQYGLDAVNLLMMVTFAFMISTIFRNSSLAIGLSIFLMFTGGQIVMLLSQYEWVKYIMFANIDLSQYIEGTPLVEGMTMGFSITILAVYFVIFNLLSWFIFNKRDITA